MGCAIKLNIHFQSYFYRVSARLYASFFLRCDRHNGREIVRQLDAVYRFWREDPAMTRRSIPEESVSSRETIGRNARASANEVLKTVCFSKNTKMCAKELFSR